jgi:chromosomal replication initiator protein
MTMNDDHADAIGFAQAINPETSWAKSYLARYGHEVIHTTLSDYPPVGFILDHIAVIHGCSRSYLLCPKRDLQRVEARQIAMYFCYELSKASFTQVAALFQKRDHTTIMYACSKIRKRRETDRQFAQKLGDIRKLIAESYEAYLQARVLETIDERIAS